MPSSRLYRVLVVAVVLALVPVGWFTTRRLAGAALPTPPGPLGLVFTDDFTGPEGSPVDPAAWKHDLGHGYPGGAANWGTGEIAEMTDRRENVALDGQGNLAITPRRDADGAWTSGRIETLRTDFAAPEGGIVRIEGRIQRPDVSGDAATGYWPAFWALGAPARPVAATNWPAIGEWDLMESANGEQTVFQTLHCGTAPGGPCGEPTGLGSGEQDLPDSATGFHTYAVEYDRGVAPEELRWSVDGRVTFTLRADRVDATTWKNANHHGFFVILNVAMGGQFPGGPPTDDTEPGVPMLVDYVAVYASGGAGPPPGPPRG